MNEISIVFLLFTMLLIVGSVVLRALRRVRFSLANMLVMMLCGGTCVSLIVGGGQNEVLLTLGLFGSLIWVAVLIAAVGRANLVPNNPPSPPEGEPPHGPESDR